MEMRKNGISFTKEYYKKIRIIYIIDVFKKLSKAVNFPLKGKFNLKLGIKLFNVPQFLSYLLFNKFYQKRIQNIENQSEQIKKFHKTGLFKGSNIDNARINLLINELNKQKTKNSNKKIFYYSFTSKIKSIIKEIVNKNLIKNILELEKYYNSNIYITNVSLFRTYHYEESNNQQFYSEKYHCDHYLTQYFKVQISLNDINEKHGPLHVFDKINTKQIMKKIKWNNRYNHDRILKKPYKNISQQGETLFFNPTECLHKAGVPDINESRLMLTIIFCALSIKRGNNLFYLDTFENKFSIWDEEDNISRKYLKPEKILDLVQTYNLYKNNKIYT